MTDGDTGVRTHNYRKLCVCLFKPLSCLYGFGHNNPPLMTLECAFISKTTGATTYTNCVSYKGGFEKPFLLQDPCLITSRTSVVLHEVTHYVYRKVRAEKVVIVRYLRHLNPSEGDFLYRQDQLTEPRMGSLRGLFLLRGLHGVES